MKKLVISPYMGYIKAVVKMNLNAVVGLHLQKGDFAMEKKGINEVSSAMRASFQKVQEVIRRNNTDYAIELLKNIVQIEPGFIDARTALRKVEKEKAATLGLMAKITSGLKITFMITKARAILGKKPQEAMNIAEDALALNLNCAPALTLLSDAAEQLKAYFISIEALELIRDFDPKNESNLKKLAGIYEAAGQGIEVLKIRQLIVNMHPGNLAAQQELRAAAALASMQTGNWESDGSFISKIKDKDEASNIEKDDRIIRNLEDVAENVSRYEKMRADGDDSVDTLRKLADLYQLGARHDEAIAVYNELAKKLGVFDPAVDRAIEKSVLARYHIQAEKLKESNAPEEKIREILTSIYNYRMERAVDRVNKYPNDTQLRYDLAIVYWDGDFIDNALEQFQYARKNPQRRVSCMVYLGRCFSQKGQNDLAVTQFKSAITEMHAMDNTKMDALYHLGVTYETMGQLDLAMDCFKTIYEANINYLDVSERMNKYYEKKKA